MAKKILLDRNKIDTAVAKQRQLENDKLTKQSECPHNGGVTPVLLHRFCSLCGKDLSNAIVQKGYFDEQINNDKT